MWSRRSQLEIAAFEGKQKRWYSRFNPIPALGIAFVLSAGLLFDDLTDWRGKFVSAFRAPLSVTDAAARFPVYFTCIFLVVFSVFILAGRHARRPSAVRTVICPRCRRTQTYFGEDFCGCGVRFEPIAYWHWTDDDEFAPST